MRMPFLPIALGSLLLAGEVLLGLNACGGGTPGITNPPPPGKIQYVVVIFQENRTPDNLFHDSVLISRGADIASSGINSNHQTIPLSPISLANQYDLGATHSSFTAEYDGGKMDGADKNNIVCAPGAVGCPPPNPQFMYVNPSEVQPYFALAEQYTFADRMFQTNQGPSFPAHQFIISGTSAPTPTSKLFAAGNPNNAGCTAPAGSLVTMIDPSGNESSQYPCFEHPTLTDLLDAKQITWRYYTLSAGSIWTGPNAIQHICQPQTQGGQLVCTGPDWTGNVVIKPVQVLTDIANHGQAQVTWVVPDGVRSPNQQRRVRPLVGSADRQRHRYQFVLVQYRHLHHLGRLGRLVRPRPAAQSADKLFAVGLWLYLRLPRAFDRRLALRETGLHFSRYG